MPTNKDPGVVVWAVGEERWHSLCQMRPCRWRSSHEDAQVAIAAIHRHLVTGHLAEPVDARSPEERDQ